MKYIKAYEKIGNVETASNLYSELVRFLRKIKEPDYFVVENFFERGMRNKGLALSVQHKDRWGPRTVFTIRIMEVSDNKLKELSIKPKLKILIDYHVYNDIFGLFLFNFISDAFRKYSYFNKKHNLYTHSTEDFFINTIDISNIINELNEEYEIYVNVNKYNL